MTKKQFMIQLTQQLSNYYPEEEYTLHTKTVTKNNDTKLQGIIIQNKAFDIAPTIYVEEFYEAYLQKKVTIPEIADRIRDFADDFMSQRAPFIHICMDWSECQNKVVYRLVSKDKNKELLENTPYLPFLNLAIIFYVVYELSDYGLESIRITNQMQEAWGISTKELFETAEFNTPCYFHAKIEDMNDVICRFLKCEIHNELMKMYVMSNEIGINGATVILYKDIIDNFAEQIQSNLYIIPSSIHEVLIVPENETVSLEQFNQMVKDVNEKHVTEDEVLSDCVYYYDRFKKKFSF